MTVCVHMLLVTTKWLENRKKLWKKLKFYIEIEETVDNLTEQPDNKIGETVSPRDPGFWKTSQNESDDEEIFDFDAAPKENPFSTCPYIAFEAEEEPPANRRLRSKR